MSDSNRNPASQTEHDRKVSQEAREYKRKGYQVQADIPGYPKPANIGNFRPDIRAKKGVHQTVVEVETPDSVDSVRDVQQQGAFHRWRRRDPARRHYRRVITD